MRRTAPALLLALALALPAHAAAAVSLSPAGDAQFPHKAFVLTLPESTRLAPGQVAVTENQQPVHDLRTSVVGAAQRAKLGVVLAIDASSSMKGEAFAGALDAARAFAEERNPRQPLALVTFGTESRVLQRFTTLDSEIEKALATPPTPSGGTHMYDAAVRSIDLVKRAGLQGGFLVVLSDGSDHGSTATSDDVVAAAHAAHVRLYTVGLESPVFDPEALSALAEQGGGRYSQATSADDLQEIYRVLGAEISNSYLVRYDSLASPGRNIVVRVKVAGLGSAAATYISPELKLPSASAAPKGADLLDSVAIQALVACLIAGLLGLALFLVLGSRRRRPRDRVAQFTGHDDDEAEPTLTGRLAAGAERTITNVGAWEGLSETLDIAGISHSAGRVLLGTAVVAASLSLLLSSVAGPLGLLPLVLVPVGVWTYISYRIKRERRIFGDQLADHLSVVGGSLRVGHSLTGALASALDEAPDPARREFARAVADERLGMPLEDALELVAARMDNREVEHISLLAKLQREAGADAGEMVDQVVDTVRERQELRRTVRTLTAQGRFSQLVLTLLPVGSLLFLTVAAHDYVQPLYTTTPGHIVLGVAFLFIVTGALVIRKIVSFTV
ncbi:MAG TPA: VWA domain-containing protein [Thermoleophilaceae bacterium]